MRRRLFSLLVLALALALAACAAKEEAKPAPAAPAAAPAEPAAVPAPGAAPAAKPAWEQEWERLLAAAKREGKVAVVGPTGADVRRVMTEGFTRQYGISVDYLGISGPEFPPRLKTERDAGQYLWDVFAGGTTTMLTSLKPMGAMDPVEPAFILPELKDPKTWREGKLLFADKDRLALLMVLSTNELLWVNTNLARTEEFKSWRDLLDPKWKGKIAVRDPRIAGAGQAAFTMFHLHPSLGPDFIRALAKQDLIIVRDERQASQWLAQGRFPVAVGVTYRMLRNLKDEGLPVKQVDPRQVKEGMLVGPGSGALTLINRAPHPNATRVYINWLLSKETQTAFVKAHDRPSWRADVPWEGEPWIIPQPGYIGTYDEKAMEVKAPLLALLQELLGR